MVRGRSGNHYWGIVLDAPDVSALGAFYCQLAIQPQTSAEWVSPVWPAKDGEQQMMMHLDVEVGDLAASVEHAVELGAVLADFQPQQNVRVLLDPAGHPFCLYVDV